MHKELWETQYVSVVQSYSSSTGALERLHETPCSNLWNFPHISQDYLPSSRIGSF